MLPYPFSRGLFLWGVPIVVPPESSPEEMEQLRQELEIRLNRMTQEAETTVLGPSH